MYFISKVAHQGFKCLTFYDNVYLKILFECNLFGNRVPKLCVKALLYSCFFFCFYSSSSVILCVCVQQAGHACQQ